MSTTSRVTMRRGWKNVSTSWALALIAMASSCSDREMCRLPSHSDAPAASPAPIAEAMAIPADWQRFSNHAFSFSTPPDVKENTVQGEDSFVGEFVGPALHITFDFGMYSDDSFGGHLGARERGALHVEDETIDGHRARIGTWEDNVYPSGHPFACSVYFPGLGGGDEGQAGEVKLQFTVAFKDRSQSDAAKTIVRSIRFIRAPRAK